MKPKEPEPNAPGPDAPTLTGTPIVTVVRPTFEQFGAQLKKVEEYTDLRDDRSSEILSQLGPQNAFWSSIVHLHPSRSPKTFELLDAATRFAVIVEMRLKHAFGCYRPNDFSPQLQPIVLTPGHGSYPSGHATQAYIIAYVLWYLLGKNKDVGAQLERQAARVAINRTVAGVHFPVDSACGRALGITLAKYFIARATRKGTFERVLFNGQAFRPDDDFSAGTDLDSQTGPAAEIQGTSGVEKAETLRWLWEQAKGEWNGKAQASSGRYRESDERAERSSLQGTARSEDKQTEAAPK